MPSADYKAVRRPRFAELNWSRAERPEPDLAQPVDSKFARLSATHEGRTLHAFGHAIVVLLDGKQTGEKFSARRRPGPRHHDHEDEWFYVMEGRLSFFLTESGLICCRRENYDK